MLVCVAKEIHLKHQAPVIHVCIIDRNAVPLPAPFEVENECARPPDMTGGHLVVICSEEQLKVVTLRCSLMIMAANCNSCRFHSRARCFCLSTMCCVFSVG